MTRKSVEITVEFFDVNGKVLDTLRAVEQDFGANFVRFFDELFDGVNGAERVGNVRNGQQFGAFREQFFKCMEVELSFF